MLNSSPCRLEDQKHFSTDHNSYFKSFLRSSGQYVPSFNSSHGSNFFDQDYKMMNILLRGSEPVQIRTSPVLFLAFNLPAMTEEEFFGANLVKNLAAFLKIPPNKIRITKIVREGTNARRRRSTGLTVEVEIREPPVQNSTSNSTG